MDRKRQVVAEYNAGETLHGLSRRHDVCRNLIRVWIAKADAGEFNDDVAAAELLATCEARIAALERRVAKPRGAVAAMHKTIFARGRARPTPSPSGTWSPTRCARGSRSAPS